MIFIGILNKKAIIIKKLIDRYNIIYYRKDTFVNKLSHHRIQTNQKLCIQYKIIY
jgi:hypothetical protein